MSYQDNNPTIIKVDNKELREDIQNVSSQLAQTEKQIIGLGTPILYGASGDGITDDTVFLQDAINNSSILDLCGKTYRISTQLNVKSNFEMRNGKIVGQGITNIIYGSGVVNVTIRNVEVDGSSTCEKGIYLHNGKNLLVKDCIVHDMTTISSSTIGVRFNGCSFSKIEGCDIYNIVGVADGEIGNDKGASRGIMCDYSNHILIDLCYIHDISPVEDADGLHFQDSSEVNDGSNYNFFNTISNSKFYNCHKRAIKIQQPGIVVFNNEILSDIPMGNDGISIYSSNVVVENNKINANTTGPIVLGSSTTPKIVKVAIRGNTVIHNKSNYSGCILISGTTSFYEDIIIDNNDLNIVYPNSTENGVVIRNIFNNIKIINNKMNGGTWGVHLRSDLTEEPALLSDKLLIANNTYKGLQNFLSISNFAYASNVIVTDNIIDMTAPLSWSENTIRSNHAKFWEFNPIINNNKEKHGYTDGLAKSGGTLSRPDNRPLYWQYYDTSISKMIIWNGASWVDLNGTVV